MRRPAPRSSLAPFGMALALALSLVAGAAQDGAPAPTPVELVLDDVALTFVPGTRVPLRARVRAGLVFDRWQGDIDGLEDPLAAETILVMPDRATRIWPAYELARSTPPLVHVPAWRQTKLRMGDADDPAIWVHPEDRTRSLIVTTDKAGNRVVAFDLAGEVVWSLPLERPNNADIRGNLLGVSENVGRNLRFFTIDPATREAKPSGEVALEYPPYGFAFYRSPKNDALYAFVSGHYHDVTQYAISAETPRTATPVRMFETILAEGMVADDAHGRIFLAEEEGGLYAYDAEPDGGFERTFICNRQSDFVDHDLEGLAIAAAPDGGGWLVMSSQGSGTFVVFERRPPFTYLGSFDVVRNGRTLDGAEHTDGIDITTLDLGGELAGGLFVCQDDASIPLPGNNFKLVPWREIATRMNLHATR